MHVACVVWACREYVPMHAGSRFGHKQPQQMAAMRNGRAQAMQQQQQQHFSFGGSPEAFWDPISEPQAFNFSSGFNGTAHQQQHRQNP